jgi:hypothetical protein
MGDRLEFSYSRQSQLTFVCVGIILVVASAYMAVTNHDIVYRIIGWLGVIVLVLCTAIAIKRMVIGGTPFVFDLAGVAFPTGNFGLVPWSEIEEYKVVTIRGHYFLALTFRHPEQVLVRVSAAKRRWARTNERLGWGHWALSFSGLTPGMNEAIAFIRDHTSVKPG